jgi:hypothetical protein
MFHLILASAPTTASSASSASSNTAAVGAAQTSPPWLHLPTHWPGQTDLLSWSQNMSPGAATMLIIAGLIYLAFGVHIYKGLVTLNAALVGAYIGAVLGNRGGNPAAGACVGAFIAAAITWPCMKYAVAMMGGIFGGLLGASIWRTVGLEPHLAWAGAMCGLIAFGLLSFILFRGSIMMYTSLQGSVMLIFGVLGLIYKYQSVAPMVTTHMQLKPFMLPIAIFIPALLGLIYQQAHFGEAEAPKKKPS